MSMVFLILPDGLSPRDYFIFSEMKLYPATYIYFLLEKITVIILAYIIANESTEYRTAIWVFFWLLCADAVDFALSYNTVWVNLDGFPVSMNILKVVVFIVAILRELWKKSYK